MIGILIKQNIQEIGYKIRCFYTKNIDFNISDFYQLDEELKKHMFRVSQYGELLADLVCLDLKKIKQIKKGALVHDLGKSLIDENILNKSEKLSPYEFEEMKKHSELGLQLLNKNHKILLWKILYYFTMKNGMALGTHLA